MSSARITGLIAALVFGALLVWVVMLTFNQDGTVLPSVRVEPRTGAATSTQAAESLLAERTRLQAESSVASGAETEKLAVNPGRLEMEPGVERPAALVTGWTANKPADAATSLRPPQHIEGISSLPYANADLLVQPEGRDWRQNHNGPVRYGGGWVIFGMCLVLALFLWGRGRIGVREAWSGRTIERFNELAQPLDDRGELHHHGADRARDPLRQAGAAPDHASRGFFYARELERLGARRPPCRSSWASW